MGIGSGEYQLRSMFRDHMNLQIVMDHARGDPVFLAKLIGQLQARGENRTSEENSLLEWACSVSRTQGTEQ